MRALVLLSATLFVAAQAQNLSDDVCAKACCDSTHQLHNECVTSSRICSLVFCAPETSTTKSPSSSEPTSTETSKTCCDAPPTCRPGTEPYKIQEFMGDGCCSWKCLEPCVMYRGYCGGKWMCNSAQDYARFLSGPVPMCMPPLFDFELYPKPDPETCQINENSTCAFTQDPIVLPQPKCDAMECCNKSHVYYDVCRIAQLCPLDVCDSQVTTPLPPTTEPSCDNVFCPMPTCIPGTTMVEIPDKATRCCKAYECREDPSTPSTTSPSIHTSPDCDNVPCTMPTCPPGTDIVEVPDRSTPCCKAYECKGTSTTSPNICATVTCFGMPTCAPGTSPQVVGKDLCCYKYECQPDINECETVRCGRPECQEGQYPYQVSDSNPEEGICCPEFECRNTTNTTPGPCDSIQCPEKPKCEDYEILVPAGENECCMNFTCMSECALVDCAMIECDPLKQEKKVLAPADPSKGICCEQAICIDKQPIICPMVMCPEPKCDNPNHRPSITKKADRTYGPCCDEFECVPSAIDCSVVRCGRPDCENFVMIQDADPENGKCCPEFECSNITTTSRPNTCDMVVCDSLVCDETENKVVLQKADPENGVCCERAECQPKEEVCPPVPCRMACPFGFAYNETTSCQECGCTQWPDNCMVFQAPCGICKLETVNGTTRPVCEGPDYCEKPKAPKCLEKMPLTSCGGIAGECPSGMKCEMPSTCKDTYDQFCIGRCARVQNEQCPSTDDMMGICVELCSGDDDCEGENICCSNGCGHVCMEPKPKCSEVMCTLYCENGFMLGDDGCPICKCKPVQNEQCPDSEGMMGLCVENCSGDDDCEGDSICCSNGCGHVCMEPKPKCSEVMCDMFCELGFQIGEDGCPICKCKECDKSQCPPKPTCPDTHQLIVAPSLLGACCEHYDCVYTPPTTCTSYFDGCNNCTRSADGVSRCTSNRCAVKELESGMCHVNTPKMCGGIAGIKCDDGFKCVDYVDDNCDPENGGRDCAGICVPDIDVCATVKCAEPQTCPKTHKTITTVDSTGCCETNRCEYIAPPGCMYFFDGCNECRMMNGEAACTKRACDKLQEGKCLDEKPAMCGGFAGITCEDGLKCIDDPQDNCDPENGGADCPGICVKDACAGVRCPSMPLCSPGFQLVEYKLNDCCQAGRCEFRPPPGCVKYTDGCNTCFLDSESGDFACTEMACFTTGEPKCLEYDCTDEIKSMCPVVDIRCPDNSTIEMTTEGCCEMPKCVPKDDREDDMCTSHDECPDGEYCQTCSHIEVGKCLPIVEEGKYCGGGFVPFQCSPAVCADDLECTPLAQHPLAPQIADLGNACCPPVKCAMKCPDGKMRKIATNGCPTCECEDIPCDGSVEEFSSCQVDKDCKSGKCTIVHSAGMELGICCSQPESSSSPTRAPTTTMTSTTTKAPTSTSTVDTKESTTTTSETTSKAPFMSCVDGMDENNQSCSCGITACDACERQNGDIICTRCQEDRFLRSNKCPRTASCKRGKIEDAPEGMQDCECPETLTNCHICILHKSKPAVCDTCRDHKKLHEGQCIDECPENYHVLLKGSSHFGARCEENYRCRKGKVKVKDHPREGEACSCEDNCFDCDYIFGKGHFCRRCENQKFWHEGKCLDSCDGTGKAHYGHRDRNRFCTDTFHCKGGKHSVDKSKCNCPPSAGGASCVRCHFEVGNGPEQARCDKCNSGFLHEGTCVAECPIGYQPNPGKGRRGRFCVEEQV